jgi:hypothetical protein
MGHGSCPTSVVATRTVIELVGIEGNYLKSTRVGLQGSYLARIFI